MVFLLRQDGISGFTWLNDARLHKMRHQGTDVGIYQREVNIYPAIAEPQGIHLPLGFEEVSPSTLRIAIAQGRRSQPRNRKPSLSL